MVVLLVRAMLTIFAVKRVRRPVGVWPLRNSRESRRLRFAVGGKEWQRRSS
jgi:hypothetical protein